MINLQKSFRYFKLTIKSYDKTTKNGYKIKSYAKKLSIKLKKL